MNRNDWEKQVFSSNMNLTAKMIAVVVGSFGNWNEDRTVWPSAKAVADMAGVTRDTAQTYLTALVEQDWLRVVKVRQNNVKEFELCHVVAEPIGILARNKRKSSDAQLQNLSATETDTLEDRLQTVSTTTGSPVVDTTEVGCRNEPDRLPKPQGLVADAIDTNIKEPTIKNIKEPKDTTTGQGPVDTNKDNEVSPSPKEPTKSSLTKESSYLHSSSSLKEDSPSGSSSSYLPEETGSVAIAPSPVLFDRNEVLNALVNWNKYSGVSKDFFEEVKGLVFDREWATDEPAAGRRVNKAVMQVNKSRGIGVEDNEW